MKEWSDRTFFPTPGEPAPWFVARCTNREQFHFDTVAGRYIVLCFFQSAAAPRSRRILDDFLAARVDFNDYDLSFFGITTDPDDERLNRICEQLPGFRYFWDFDWKISRLYGVVDCSGSYRPCAVVLDTRLRVLAVFPFGDDPQNFVTRVMQFLAALPPIAPETVAAVQAPVLVVPYVFEPELCRALIRSYEEHGGHDSGFMCEKDGKTVEIINYGHKRRRDCEIEDEKLRNACMIRIHDRLVPEIAKAFQFHATRMERYIVACYDAETCDHFRPHRDNTTKGTAHRRFAVSLHLNTGEYEGGNVRFPEFGRQTYTAPVGGAVVFSCSLLHEATQVTRGRRYMFLPFLYDDEAARIREQNQRFLGEGVSVETSDRR
jgi:peroxiredoxin